MKRVFTVIVRVPEDYISPDDSAASDQDSLTNGHLSFAEIIELADDNDDISIKYRVEDIDN